MYNNIHDTYELLMNDARVFYEDYIELTEGDFPEVNDDMLKSIITIFLKRHNGVDNENIIWEESIKEYLNNPNNKSLSWK